MTVTTYQKMALMQELELSIKLIKLGLCELRKIDSVHDFYHLPSLLLSSGFERLMKCMICFKYLNDTDKFPNYEELLKGISGGGHSLVDLKKRVILDCISKDTAYNREATKKDYIYISEDSELDEIIYILSEFGNRARYHNLNIVLQREHKSTDYESLWNSYEIKVIKAMGALSELTKPGEHINELYKEITKNISIKLELFARALTRQFTLGDLGKEAGRHVGIIGPFLYLTDEQIGTYYHCEE